MADKRISELTSITSLDGTENVVYVQTGETKKGTVNDMANYIIGNKIEVQKETTTNLDDSEYENIKLVQLSWIGDIGNMTLNLPTASTHENRAIRFISDNTFETNTRVHLTPQGGDTLDGSTDYFEINKAYEGIYVWSNGDEWFIIQKKA